MGLCADQIGTGLTNTREYLASVRLRPRDAAEAAIKITTGHDEMTRLVQVDLVQHVQQSKAVQCAV
jgi:hypothetical protein